MPLEALGDRTAYLKAILSPFDDLAALKAVPSPKNGLIRFVHRYGFYIYDSAMDRDDADDPFYLAADDGTAGAWLHELFGALGTAGGIPQLRFGKELLVADPGFPIFETWRTKVRAVSLHDYRITELTTTRAKSARFVPFYAVQGMYGAGGLAPNGGDADFSDGVFTFRYAPAPLIAQGISINLDPYVHDGALLMTVKAQVQPAASHAGLPQTPWSMGVFRKPKFAAGLTSLQSAGDFWPDIQASLTAYQANHAVTVTLNQNRTIDRESYTHSLQIWNEHGSNSLAGLKVFGLEISHGSIQDMRFP